MVRVSQLREQLADREAIRECLYRYARGVDRMDADMLRSAYWPDAIDTHLTFKGTIEEFIAWSFPLMAAMDQTSHIIGNIFIAMHGPDKASVESYFYGLQRINVAGDKNDVVAAGRYLDSFEKRDDEWRVAKRFVQTDWFRHYPDSADWSQGMMGMMIQPGGHKPDDPSYALLDIV